MQLFRNLSKTRNIVSQKTSDSIAQELVLSNTVQESGSRNVFPFAFLRYVMAQNTAWPFYLQMENFRVQILGCCREGRCRNALVAPPV